jgi:hypothetical protein
LPHTDGDRDNGLNQFAYLDPFRAQPIHFVTNQPDQMQAGEHRRDLAAIQAEGAAQGVFQRDPLHHQPMAEHQLGSQQLNDLALHHYVGRGSATQSDYLGNPASVIPVCLVLGEFQEASHTSRIENANG